MNLLKKYATMFRKDMKDVMSRRCGLDELNNLLILIVFFCFIVALVTWKGLIALLGLVVAVLCCIRAFSKKLEQRKKENDIYMHYMGGVVRVVERGKLSLKMMWKTYKDSEYAYFVCSQCGQIIRVPKGKNKVSVRCPKCSRTFVRKT